MSDTNYSPEELQRALNSLSGEESLFSDITDALGITGSKLEQVKALGEGKLSSKFAMGANTVARLTSKALGYNDGVIRSLLSRANSKKGEPVNVPAKMIATLTSDGDLNYLLKDQKTLSTTITTIMRFHSDLDSYGKTSLQLMKEIAGSKTTEELIKVITHFELLEPPKLILVNKKEGETHSNILPGGKVIKCTTGNVVNYSMTGELKDVNAEEFQFEPSLIKEYLNQSRWINTQQKSLSEIINDYSSHIKKWSDGVKQAQAHLDKLDGVSSSAINRATSLMTLEVSVVNFHTAFLPRLIAYLNNYIEQGNDLFTTVLD